MLHGERLSGREKCVHPLDRPIPGLPDGAMIGVGENSFVVVAEGVRRWTPSGYIATTVAPGGAMLLTPPSILRVLAAGYRPRLHPSAFATAHG